MNLRKIMYPIHAYICIYGCMSERESECVVVGGEMYGKRVRKREKETRRKLQIHTNFIRLYKPQGTKLEDLYLVIVSRDNSLLLYFQVR